MSAVNFQDSTPQHATISKKALLQVLGKNIGSSIIPKKPIKTTIIIPNFEILRPGDIILSREINTKGTGSKSFVVNAQHVASNRTYKDYTDKDSQWTHAMIYTYGLQVAESLFFSIRNNRIANGLRVSPLTKYSAKHEMIICRHIGLSKKVEEQFQAALYALGICAVTKRRYPIARIVRSALTGKSRPKDLANSTSCSEFALECLAIGGSCMTQQYADLVGGLHEYYPADFHASSEFEKIPMTYFKLVD